MSINSNPGYVVQQDDLLAEVGLIPTRRGLFRRPTLYRHPSQQDLDRERRLMREVDIDLAATMAPQHGNLKHLKEMPWEVLLLSNRTIDPEVLEEITFALEDLVQAIRAEQATQADWT